MPIIFLIYNFYDHPISNTLDNWGQFGDYLSGISGPILAIINMLLFVMLSLEIERSDSRRSYIEYKRAVYIDLQNAIHEITTILNSLEIQKEKHVKSTLLLIRSRIDLIVFSLNEKDNKKLTSSEEMRLYIETLTKIINCKYVENPLQFKSNEHEVSAFNDLSRQLYLQEYLLLNKFKTIIYEKYK